MIGTDLGHFRRDRWHHVKSRTWRFPGPWQGTLSRLLAARLSFFTLRGDPRHLDSQEAVQTPFPDLPTHIPVKMGQEFNYSSGAVLH